jgi:hypothetical protein
VSALKQRTMRAYQAKHRGSKTSFKTQIENLQILLAWEAAELTEGQAARALNVCRIEAREMREKAIRAGEEIAGEIIAMYRSKAARPATTTRLP